MFMLKRAISCTHSYITSAAADAETAQTTRAPIGAWQQVATVGAAAAKSGCASEAEPRSAATTATGTGVP